MAITQRAVGTWAAVNATTQTVTLPTHAAGDMLILRAVCKPFGAAIVCNTAGWAAVAAQNTNGSTANGVGVGSQAYRAFYKIATSGAETNPVVTWGTTADPGAAVAASYQKASTEAWVTPVGDGGGDATARTSQTSTIDTHVTVVAGDLVDFYRGVADDSGTLTVPTITQTGVTYNTVTESPAAALSSGTGSDIAVDGGYRTATAGTSSAAAVVTGTSTTSEEHGAWMTRLRVNQEITLGLLDAAPALYAPTVQPDQFLTVPLLGGGGAVAFVQHLGDAGITATFGDTLALSISKTVTVGNTIFVGGAGKVGDGSHAISATDNLGNAYSFVEGGDIDTVLGAGLLVAPVTVGGTLTTITVTFSEPTDNRVVTAAEFSGVGTLSVAGGGTTGSSTATATWVASKTIPANGLAIGAVARYAPAAAITAGSASGSPSTSITLDTLGTANPTIVLAYAIAGGSSVTSFSGTCGITGSDDWAAFGGVYDAAAVAQAVLYAPTVAQVVSSQTITLALLDAAPALYAPTLAAKSSLTVPFLDAAPALYAPAATFPTKSLTIPLLDANPTPTVVFDCGFEDAAVTTHWAQTGGIAALDSTIAGRTGTNALRLDLTNSAVQQMVNVGLGLVPVQVRTFRFRCSALPTGNTRIVMLEGTVYDSHIQLASSGTLIFTAGGTSANSTSPIVANTWYKIDLAVDGANQLARWSIDGVAQTNPGAAGSTQTINTFYFGKSNLTATGVTSFYYDDVAFSDTFADYPFGIGSVNASDVWVSLALYAPAVSTTIALPLLDAGPALYAPTVQPDQFLTGIGGLGAYAGTVLNDNPIAYWRLGEPSGTSAVAAVGPNGTYQNTPTLGVTGLLTGDTDTAVTFDPASAEAVGISTGMPAGSSVGASVEMWLDTAASLPAFEIWTLWSRGDTAGPSHTLRYRRWDDATVSLFWIFWDGSTAQSVYPVTWATHTAGLAGRRHVVMVHDYAGQTVKAYVDGVLVGTGSAAAFGTPVAPAANASSRIAGYMGNDVFMFPGTMDEVAVYDSILSATQILAHYTAGTSPQANLYAPSLAAKNTLTVPLLDAAPALYAPTVQPDQFVTIPLLDGAPTLTAPSLTVGAVTLTIPQLDAGPALYAPTIATAADTITLPQLDAVPALSAPSLTTTNALTIGLIDAGPAVYVPSITTLSSLTIPQLDASSTTYAPTVTPAAWPITVPYLDAVPATYAPTVIPDQFVTLALLDAGGALYAPSLAAKSTLTIPQLDAGPSLSSPTVYQDAFLTPPLLDGAPAVYQPTISTGGTFVIPLLDAGGTLYAPTVAPGAVGITVPQLDASSALYAPSLTAKSTIALGLLDASSALYGPTITPTWALTVPQLVSSSALYAPAFAVGPVTVSFTLLTSAGALYDLTVSGVGGATQTLTLGQLDGAPALYAPTLGGFAGLTPPTLISSSALYSPTLVSLAPYLVLPQLDAGGALLAPVITPTWAIAIPLVASTADVYAPELGKVNTIPLAYLDAEAALYAPTFAGGIDVGAADIVITAIDSGTLIVVVSPGEPIGLVVDPGAVDIVSVDS